MVCKVLFFEYGKNEEYYFENNETSPYFDIQTFEKPLTEETLPNCNLDQVSMISISSKSLITSNIVNKFKNLRLIATRTEDFSHIDIKSCFDKNIAVINVEPPHKSYDYNIKNSFKGMKSFLCGGKDNRIV